MNIELIILSIILVTLVFLPFILIPFVQNSGSKSLKSKFRNETTRLGLNPDISDKWNCNFIGIDTAQKKLLFVQKIDENFISEMIDLNSVSQSRVVITEVQKNSSKKGVMELQRVDLEFSFYSGTPKKLMSLYDGDVNYTQDLEVKHAETWNSQISALIKNNNLLRKSA